MSSSLPANIQSDVVLLWRSRIWECLKRQNESAARSRLLSIGDASPRSDATQSSRSAEDTPAARLKTRKVLATSNEVDFAAGLAAYNQLAKILVKNNVESSLDHEHLVQARGQFLSYHINSKRPYRPGLIRQILLEDLAVFPNNTILLELYVSSRSKFGVEDRLHAIAEDRLTRRSTSTEGSIIVHTYNIADELRRSALVGGTVHAVRAAFDRATESKAGRHCESLWQAYVDFELRQDRPDATAIRNTFRSGLVHLPWCKGYMLRAFGVIRNFLSQDDLRNVMNVLEEKELRLLCHPGEVG